MIEIAVMPKFYGKGITFEQAETFAQATAEAMASFGVQARVFASREIKTKAGAVIYHPCPKTPEGGMDTARWSREGERIRKALSSARYAVLYGEILR